MKYSLGCCLALLSTTAVAAPLTLEELDEMAMAVECRLVCESANIDVESCIAACPVADPNWEKSGDTRLDDRDRHLAALEHWDESTLDYICYETEGAVTSVVPAPLCGECTDNHSAPDCIDADGDGLLAWQEAELGTSDTVANTLNYCDGGWECGFVTSCQFSMALSEQFCRARDCEGGQCTAFHLEKVSENNQELIAHVHFDYAPVPPTVLDLHIKYEQAALTLLDVRPLSILRDRNKEIHVTHLANGTLRLVVLDSFSVAPIPNGPIIELVFQRKSTQQTSVAFETDNFAQAHSMAPSQGAAQDELRNDALWGASIAVAAANTAGPRVLLHYSFDDPQQPLAYADVPSADVLCGAVSTCNGESNALLKAKFKSKLADLQKGTVSGGETIVGINAEGTYLRGTSDHLQLPLTLNTPFNATSQSLSWSTWFYAEGNTEAEGVSAPQILFSHNTHSERTRFGVQLVPQDDTSASLQLFEDDHTLGATIMPLADEIPLRRWTHLGVSLDATSGRTRAYLDGQIVRDVLLSSGASTISCPQFSGPNLLLHQEGDVLGGRRTEQLYAGVGQPSGLFAVERMDTNGLVREKILSAPDRSFVDPDYSPIVDKLVYSSNATGSYEIWISDANGSLESRKVVTVGFGDASREMVARKPKWAPDGSAIIFESNAYDIAGQDNLSRAYHLYYVEFDAAAGVVSVPLPNGSRVSTLAYKDRIPAIGDYRLTAGFRHNFGAIWLSGKSTEDRGDIVFTSSAELFDERRVEQLTIPNNINAAIATELELFDSADEAEVVDAYRRSSPTTQSEILVKRGSTAFEVNKGDSEHFTIEVTEDAPFVEVRIIHSPTGYSPTCWDLNGNGLQDLVTEDLNDDELADEADCYLAEARNLYLRFDPDILSFEDVIVPAEMVEGDKKLEVIERFSLTDALLHVDVRSPINRLPLDDEDEVVTILMEREVPGATGLELVGRVTNEDLYLKDLTNSDPPELLQTEPLEQVSGGVFSPDGEQMLLAGTSNAAPVLVRLEPGEGVWRISEERIKIRGVTWVQQERFYACNWVGAFRAPQTGVLQDAFRGGLDDFKLYSYVREPEAFRSEAERGAERLARENRRDVDSRLVTTCATDLDCDPYHLCVDDLCEIVSCDPEDEQPCERGACTLRPTSIEHADEFEWVCTAECDFDTQCFQKQCLNGPCRFCDDQSAACIECRPTVKDYGAFQVATIEGCPDSNSFACDDGSCVTECYSFDDAATTYLCDPGLEYCDHGRCVLFEWSWTDLAPATFSGLDRMRLRDISYTTAISEIRPIEIKAYGVEDNGRSPTIIVEGRDVNVYSDWFTLGLITVHNRYVEDADAHPYYLSTSHNVTDLRLRLVVLPYDNLNAGASGLLGRDGNFCIADADAWAEAHSTTPNYAPCTWRTPGSLANNGYQVGIPDYVQRQACVDAGGVGCTAETDPRRKYLLGGRPAIAVTGIKVDGTSYLDGITSNEICSYEGSTEPMDGTRRKKLVFGGLTHEISNERDRFCASNDCNAPGLQGLVDFTSVAENNWALLNCSFAKASAPSEIAGVEINGIILADPANTAIDENPNSCLVETGTEAQPRLELCFESMTDAAIDPFSSEMQARGILEFSNFSSFGDEEP